MLTTTALKLLKETEDSSRVPVDELAASLGVTVRTAQADLTTLAEKRLVTLHAGIVEVDTHQRLALAEKLIRSGQGPDTVSRFLKWQEFENFAEASLRATGFLTVRHLVFKNASRKYEIDILAWNDVFLLSVDCKHWSHGFSPSRIRTAAQAQVERSEALARRVDVLGKHLIGKIKDRSLVPVILALGDPRERISNGVPIVSVLRLRSFLEGASPYDQRLRVIKTGSDAAQKSLYMDGKLFQ